MLKKMIILVGIFLLVANTTQAAIVTLQPGPEGKDSSEYFNYRHYPGQHGLYETFGFQNFTNGPLGAGRMDGYIQFNLSELTITNIQSAFLQLYVGPPSSMLVSTIYANRIIEPWEELIISEDNLPGYTTIGQVANENTIEFETWITWDITEIVDGWINGTYENYGLMLYTPDITEYDWMNCYSSDYSTNPALRPKLVINTVPIPTTLCLFSFGVLGLIGLRKKSL